MPTLFRDRAIAARRSDDVLDTRVRVVSIPAWTSLVLAIMTVCGFVVWLVVGSVAVTLGGAGVVSNVPANAVVPAPVAGVLVTSLPPLGTAVTAGQRVAEVRTATDPAAPTVVVDAPVAGTVVALGAGAGATVKPGDPLGLIAPNSGAQVGYVFVTAQKAGGLSPGMQALLSPASVDATADGLLVGEVAMVSPLPAQASRVTYLTGDPAYAASILDAGPVIEVQVRLLPDPGAPTGYAWTQPPGPSQPLVSGVPSQATFVLDRVAPYRAFFGGR